MRRSILLPLAVLLLGGCVSRTTTVEQAPAGAGVGPSLLVERFLQAANSNDIQTMSRLFGTEDGPIIERDPRDQVEQRMFTLASLLRHQDFSIVGEQVVPGRIGSALTIVTRVRQRSREVRVPFTVVRTADGGWLVEQIGVEDLARRGS